MAWRRIAAVTGIFIAIGAPLASRPTFKSLLRGGADDATPATPTIRRRATAGGNSPALAKKQSVARDVRGFGARGGGGFGAPGARRDLIATDDNWLEDYCWSFDRRTATPILRRPDRLRLPSRWFDSRCLPRIRWLARR